MLRSGTITNTGTQNLNRLRKISFGKLRRARFRLSSRSQISGSRFMTMGFWSRGPQYRLGFIRLWHLTKRGTRVIIARQDVVPVEITNPHLFASKSKTASDSPENRVIAVASDINKTSSAAQVPLMSNVDMQKTADTQTAGSTPSGTAPQKIIPISVFVSRKLSRLFVRQGFAPLFDVPIKIQNPEEPLGTHVFTVMESENEGSAFRWSVVSIPEVSTSPDPTKERKAPKQQIVETAPSVQSSDYANTALDRIEIPQDAVERISELLTPGYLLIISDYGMSSEIGPYTATH